METITRTDAEDVEFDWDKRLRPAWSARMKLSQSVDLRRGTTVRLEDFGPATGVWTVDDVEPTGSVSLSRER